ncbi:hypothetical protein [Anabaena sp. UHCC 0451]|uniref:hypothetical protein n=1 Tax=Anabaena sp. UHCC 0451 TaxID=2055235 RepID=UPI002B202049|nr:hypothetical protein [Anabaena sp. UHCC 0451]MEA5576626.1 hypothetical protein [Anabaena sp. UHCC 0451]
MYYSSELLAAALRYRSPISPKAIPSVSYLFETLRERYRTSQHPQQISDRYPIIPNYRKAISPNLKASYCMVK